MFEFKFIPHAMMVNMFDLGMRLPLPYEYVRCSRY